MKKKLRAVFIPCLTAILVIVLYGCGENNGNSLKSTTASSDASSLLVTPSIDANAIVSPSTVQAVTSGQTLTFTVTPNSGYTVDSAVGGTCPAGSWNGSTYTTGVITSACTVSFTSSTVSLSITSFSPATGTTSSVPTSIAVTFSEAVSSLNASNVSISGTCATLPTVSSVANNSSTTATIALTYASCNANQTAIVEIIGVTSASSNTALSGTTSVTFTQSAGPVYVYKATGVTSGVLGSRSATTSTCQSAQTSNYSSLSCSHWVALLGYTADSGVQHLPANYGLPQTTPFLSASSVGFESNWNALLNDTNPGASLNTAGILTSGYAWTGFRTGGALGNGGNCSEWTDATYQVTRGDAIQAGSGHSWNSLTSAGCWATAITNFLCMCW